jgi:hypothetical protein
VVHSVDEAMNGTGALVYPGHASGKRCYQVSEIAAYKCTQMGVLAAFRARNVEMTNVIGIDNGHGILAVTQAYGSEYSPFGSSVINVKTFGDFAESLDCPENGGFCIKISKAGFFAGGAGKGGGIRLHPNMKSMLPN